MKKWTPKQVISFRKAMGMSQTAFGNLFGVTRIHIYYLEKGVKEPSKTLKLLLDCVEEKIKRVRMK